MERAPLVLPVGPRSHPPCVVPQSAAAVLPTSAAATEAVACQSLLSRGAALRTPTLQPPPTPQASYSGLPRLAVDCASPLHLAAAARTSFISPRSRYRPPSPLLLAEEAPAGATSVSRVLVLAQASPAMRPLHVTPSAPAAASSLFANAASGSFPHTFEGPVGSKDYWLWAGQAGRM